ncbi:protein YgfX [Shewanella algicola]|uniref:protein YgfX n=1 Tax=Shewanella algicola TaxID=640633 RepID=UPI00227D8252|nr:protein YgfX [Shewanella algicola]
MVEPNLKPVQASDFSPRTHLHQFGLSASFLSRVALVCFFAVILCSFLAWPNLASSMLVYAQLLLALLTLCLMVYCWRKLTRWQCIFSLDKRGFAQIVEHSSQTYLVDFCRRALVNPLFCMIFLQDIHSGERRILWVWHDMLTDTEYRTLCRLLLQLKLA